MIEGTDLSSVMYEFEISRTRSQIPAEHALFMSVLFDAVEIVHKGKTEGKKAIEYREAVAWINSNEDIYLFSFCHICSVLDVSPSLVRQKLFKKNTQ